MTSGDATPSGYHSVQPYLIFTKTTAAIDFYRRAFGATERLCMKDPDGRVAHAEVLIGDSCVMMADENPSYQTFGLAHYGGSPIKLMLYVDDCDAVYNRALDEGATSEREPADQEYGDRIAGVIDPFGYFWYLGTKIREMSRDELEALGGQAEADA